MRLNSPLSMVNRRWSVNRLLSLCVASGLLAAVALPNAVSATVHAQQYTFEEVSSGLKHADAATRMRAIQILKDADYAEAAGPIGALLEDPEDKVQLAAIDAERSLFAMRPVARRRKIGFVVEVRSIAGGEAAAEGRIALKARSVPVEILSALRIALRDANPRVRAEAINLASLLAPQGCRFGDADPSNDVCGGIGDALINNINSREPLLRRSAMLALGELGYSNAAQALSDQLSYYQTGLDAEAALEGLAGIGHSTSAAIFLRLLTSPNAEMRRLAVEGLARAGEREALAELQQLASAEKSAGVLLAIHFAALKLSGSEGSLEHLVAALRYPAQRSLAIKYLLDLSPTIGPALAQSLLDESADVRRLIADIIGFSGDARVVSALQSATKDSNPDVALAAQRAIDRINIR